MRICFAFIEIVLNFFILYYRFDRWCLLDLSDISTWLEVIVYVSFRGFFRVEVEIFSTRYSRVVLRSIEAAGIVFLRDASFIFES